MEFKDGLEGLATFVALHRAQLQSSGVPDYFWETLYNKLKHGVIHWNLIDISYYKSLTWFIRLGLNAKTGFQTFDAGLNFGLTQIEPEEDEEDGDSLLKNPFCCWKALATCPEGIKASDPNQ